MNNTKLNGELRQMAVTHGLCSQWQEDWKDDWSPDTMVDKFFRGIDFYLSERFVSGDFLLDNFGRPFLRKKSILVDDSYSLINPARSILIGNSTSTIRFNGNRIATVYLTDSSSCKIKAHGNCHVIIHLLDKSVADVEQSEKARVIALRHSEDCTVDIHGNVEIKEEFEYLK